MRLEIVLIALSLLGNACSPTKTIANNVTETIKLARSSHERFETIAEESRKTEHIDVLSIGEQAREGAMEQQEIIEIMYGTVEVLPMIEDASPWWISTLNYGLLVLGIIGTFAVLWYLGLGKPIKAIMRLFTSLIPSGKREAAKLMKEAQDPESKTTVAEAVAVLRATDKDFDAAYRKESK